MAGTSNVDENLPQTLDFLNECTSGFSVINLYIGYTQGELNALEEPDYDDAFKLKNHVYWKYTIIHIDNENIEHDCLYIDWKEPDALFYSDLYDDVASEIASRIEATTDEMFGRTIPAICFKILIMAVIDEPDDELTSQVTDQIGGYFEIEEEATDQIAKENVNSMFAYFEEIDRSKVGVKNGKITVNGSQLQLNEFYDDGVESRKLAYFTEDVMNYEE